MATVGKIIAFGCTFRPNESAFVSLPDIPTSHAPNSRQGDLQAIATFAKNPKRVHLTGRLCNTDAKIEAEVF